MTFGVRMGPDASPERWKRSRPMYGRGPHSLYRRLKSIQFLVTRDRAEVLEFIGADYSFPFPLSDRLGLLRDFLRITNAMRGYHTLEEILRVSDRIFRAADRGAPVVVEAGAGSGSSTAKLSLVTRRVSGRLFVFDSFRGIPPNTEQHRMLDGRELVFREGAFRGRLGAVRRRVEALGAIEVCTFEKGLFEHTLPNFREDVDVALLDVDLLSSTRTCVKHLFPRLRPGGSMFSQDGHLQAIVDLFREEGFWREEVGVLPPKIEGLGRDKLLELTPQPSPSGAQD